MISMAGLAGCGGETSDFIAGVDDIILTKSNLERLYSIYSEQNQRLARETCSEREFVKAWVDQTLLGLYASEQNYGSLEPVVVFSEVLRRQIILRTMGNELILCNVNVDENELRALYDSTPSEVKVLHYKAKNEKHVASVLERVARGESFEKYAIGSLLPVTKEKPGGFYRPDDFPLEVKEIIDGLDVGENSGVIEFRNWFHAIQVVGKRGFEIGPFDEQMHLWRNAILEVKADIARNAFVDSLFNKYPVKTNEEGMHLIHSMIQEYEVGGGEKPFFEQPIDGREDLVLVTMGSESVTLGEFFSEMKYTKSEMRPFITSKIIEPFIRSHVLEKVMCNEALRRGLGEIDYVRFLLQDAVREAQAYYLREEMNQAVEFSTEEIDEYIQNNIDEFIYPDRMLIREIVVKDENECWDIYRDLENGASFRELALSNSISITAKSHGRIGPFKKERYPEYWAVADTLEPGEYTKPIYERGAWAIIKLEQRLNRVPMETEYSRKLALKAMQERAYSERMKDFLDYLAEEHKVRYSREYAF